MAVVADPEAVSFISERGRRLYVYADHAGMKHVMSYGTASSRGRGALG
jgi:hypothetical protein